MENKIKLMNDTKKTYYELANELETNQSISIFANDMFYSCWWSDCNEGWYYVIYQVEDLEKDKYLNYITDDLNEEFEFDGGLCSGNALDAIEMMLLS